MSGILKSRKGFTLIEAMLTLSITAVIALTLLSAFRLGISSLDKGGKKTESSAVKRTFIQRLAKDIGSAYPYRETDGFSRGFLFQGGEKSLGFAAASDPAMKMPWGGARWVYYSEDRSGISVVEKTLPSESGALRTKAGAVAAEGLKDLRFEYLGGEGWTSSWDSRMKRALPKAIKISISSEDGRQAAAVVPIGMFSHGTGIF